jgi:hypothetical protein
MWSHVTLFDFENLKQLTPLFPDLADQNHGFSEALGLWAFCTPQSKDAACLALLHSEALAMGPGVSTWS